MADSNHIQQSLDAALVGYLNLSASSMAEINYLLAHHEDDSNQYWRRTFIRAAWSLIDGDIYALKEMCRSVKELRADVIKNSDEELLSSDRQETGDKIKGVLKLARTIFDLPITLDFAGTEWATVGLAIEKRHNIVHPKSVDTLVITDDQWKQQKEAIGWFLSTSSSLLVALEEK